MLTLTCWLVPAASVPEVTLSPSHGTSAALGIGDSISAAVLFWPATWETAHRLPVSSISSPAPVNAAGLGSGTEVITAHVSGFTAVIASVAAFGAIHSAPRGEYARPAMPSTGAAGAHWPTTAPASG